MTTARTARRATGAALTAAAITTLALALGSATAPPARASVPLNCAAAPSSCGYPDATTAGVPAGTTLQTVPGQVTSGPGWSYSASTGTTTVTGKGAVLNDLSITGNLDVKATNVTISNDKIITSGTYGVSLRHAAGTTITNSTIGGQNATTGRVNYAIDDIYGDSAGLAIKNSDISNWRVAINASAGQITGNYIHSPGFLAGDHTDGIYDAEGTTQLTISDNTILNSLNQACAIMLQSAAGVPVSNLTVTGNLLGGGGYAIYAGGAQNDSTNIKITNNRFSQQYFSLSGQYGPVAQYQATGAGNTWTGNIWDTTGTTVSP
jgi:Right handed beta helix region